MQNKNGQVIYSFELCIWTNCFTKYESYGVTLSDITGEMLGKDLLSEYILQQNSAGELNVLHYLNFSNFPNAIKQTLCVASGLIWSPWPIQKSLNLNTYFYLLFSWKSMDINCSRIKNDSLRCLNYSIELTSYHLSMHIELNHSHNSKSVFIYTSAHKVKSFAVTMYHIISV